MRRVILLLFVIMALLGIAIAGWAGLGDSSVIAGTAGVHEALRVHGQAENVALRNDLYDVVLRLQWPWAVAQWLGLGVVVVSVIGVAVVWRSRHDVTSEPGQK
jgi:hypothetical protein